MDDHTTALVIASNRQDQVCEFLAAWYGGREFPWDLTVLVQDGGGTRFHPEDAADRSWRELHHYEWSSISKEAGGDLPAWLARRDSGIKVWGFLKAVLDLRADVVIALDDDCLPCELAADPSWHRKGTVHEKLIEAARASFVEQHVAALYHTDRWTTSIPGFIPRGMPYGTDGDGRRQPRIRRNSLGEMPVSLNMGVWATIPDRDAVHELTNWTPEGYYKVWKPQRDVYRHTRVMSPQQYWPLCGMNIAFRREIAPLMYFPRMGDGVDFRRFDDIWCGVVAQKCLRHLGLSCSVGKPIVSHMKASLPMDNLVRESPGIRANEEFWQIIEGIELGAGEKTPLLCMQRIGSQLRRGTEVMVRDEQLRLYTKQLGGWILEWCDQFVGKGW